jgi:hypothetical protein
MGYEPRSSCDDYDSARAADGQRLDKNGVSGTDLRQHATALDDAQGEATFRQRCSQTLLG